MGSKTLRDVDNHSLLTWHLCPPTATQEPERETNAEAPHLKHLSLWAQAGPSRVCPLSGVCVLLPGVPVPVGPTGLLTAVSRGCVWRLRGLTHAWPPDPGILTPGY